METNLNVRDRDLLLSSQTIKLSDYGIYRLPTQVHQLMADAIDRFRAGETFRDKDGTLMWKLEEVGSIEQNQSRLLTILKDFVEEKHPGMQLNYFVEFTIDDVNKLPGSLPRIFSWGIWYQVIDATKPLLLLESIPQLINR